MKQQQLFSSADTRGADISPCGRYRYAIWRSWGPRAARWVNFILLNPSTADATINDPTLRRCMNFAHTWGDDGLWITNLYALRSTDPQGLLRVNDPVGPKNDESILYFASRAAVVVCAWGTHADEARKGRQTEALNLLKRLGVSPRLLRATRDGYPQHPLYLPKGLFYRPWEPADLREEQRNAS